MKQIVIIFLFLSCHSLQLFSQNTFKGGITLGTNISQINGDKSYGYNKFGLIGGVQVSLETSEKNFWSTGILYSQRGSRPKKSEVVNRWTINLPYIEVPLTYNIKDWKVEDKDFYRMHAGIGLVYGRLFNPSASTLSGWEGKENYFRSNNLSWITEVTFFQTKHIGYSFRYTRDIIRIFQSNNDLPDRLPLVGHMLTLKGVYIF